MPPIDLKSLLEKARQSGRLTSTCPWIIEYLLQCDPVTLLLPSYQHILKILLCLYKDVFVMSKTGETESNLALSNINFLRFHLGMLFSYRNFPDTVFALLKSQELVGSVEWIGNSASSAVVGEEGLVDLVEDVARSLVDFFFEETFSRFKRILSWGKLEVSHPAITGKYLIYLNDKIRNLFAILVYENFVCLILQVNSGTLDPFRHHLPHPLIPEGQQ